MLSALSLAAALVSAQQPPQPPAPPAPSAPSAPPADLDAEIVGPLRWRGDALHATVRFRLTPRAPAGPGPARAELRLVLGRDTVVRTIVEASSPGRPGESEVELALERLASVALAGPPGPARLIRIGSADEHPAPLDPADVLRVLDGRIAFGGWRASGSRLETRVIVPPALADLTLDLLVPEFGPSARYAVNGRALEWRDGVVTLCGPCAPGVTLEVRVDNAASSAPADLPQVRIRDRTYSDVARNGALLTAFGEPAAVAPPDPRAWLAAALDRDKASYRALAERADSLLTLIGGRLRDDTILLVGHAPIDHAASGPRLTELGGVVEATWRSALRLQRRFPGTTFAAGPAPHYRWIEHHAHELLDSIGDAVRRGTWSVTGGWCLPPDRRALSGEGLVRQGFYAQRDFARMFGTRATTAWVPSGAHCPASLPQLWQGLGIRALVTDAWAVDHTTGRLTGAFVWEGVDGSRVFAYQFGDSSRDLTPARLARAAATARGSADTAIRLLVPYAVLERGAAAAVAALEGIEELRRLPAYPALRDARVEVALAALGAARPAGGWPVWRGVLGGETTPGAGVRRESPGFDAPLIAAELLAALDAESSPQAAIERAWEQAFRGGLLDAASGLATDSARATASAVRDTALARLASQAETRGSGMAVVVFNPTSWVRTSWAAVAVDPRLASVRAGVPLRAVDAAQRATLAVVDADTLRFLAREVPPLGFKVFWIRRGAADAGPLTGDATRLENAHLRVEVDTTTGELVRVYDRARRREVLPTAGRGNVLSVRSGGRADEERVLDSVRGVRWGGDAATRWIEVEKPWAGGTVTQRIVLRRDELCVTIATDVGQAHPGAQFSVAWDLGVATDSVTYEIPYAVIVRATPRGGVSAGHRWGDVSAAGFGVSLLTDARPDWQVRGSQIRLTVSHGVTYAVYSHDGDWRSALTVRRAAELEQPLLARVEPTHPGLLGRSWSFAAVDAENVHVTAVKRAEEGRASVLRVVETHGRPTRATLVFGRRLLRVRAATLLEHPLATLDLAGDRRAVAVTLRPFEVATLLVEPAR